MASEINEMLKEFECLDRAFYEADMLRDEAKRKVQELIMELEAAGVSEDELRRIDNAIYDEYINI